MKKLQLKSLQFDSGQVLTRAQLKNVLGGAFIPFTNGCNGSCTGNDFGPCPSVKNCQCYMGAVANGTVHPDAGYCAIPI